MDMLPAVYLAESLLGSPFERVSAYVDSAKEGDHVEGLAHCRFEPDGAAAPPHLQPTVAAYASAATGASVAVPLPADSLLDRQGVLGLGELDVPAWSALRQRGLFGLRHDR
jgi:hypothetical protein